MSGQAPPKYEDGETSDGESSEDEEDLQEPVNGERVVRELPSTIAPCTRQASL